MNKMRDEFEEWAAEESEVREVGELIGLLKDEHHDRYSMIWTQTAWMAWQASRAALMIELPDDGIEDCQEAWGDRCKNTFDCGYNFASLRHEQAIEAAGLKVTP